MAICPKCEKPVTSVTIDSVDVATGTRTYKGVSYTCPSCHCVLSVAIDPVALKADTVSEILKALGRG